MAKKKSVADCPCGSGKSFERCCNPLIEGTRKASTAEALMRSRFSAYALQNEAYLLASWHASTRPQHVDMDPLVKWIRLEIVKASEDEVEFIATYRVQGKAGRLHENSRVVYEEGKWYYLDGVML